MDIELFFLVKYLGDEINSCWKKVFNLIFQLLK